MTLHGRVLTAATALQKQNWENRLAYGSVTSAVCAGGMDHWLMCCLNRIMSPGKVHYRVF